jgi:hypothetical protein
MQHPFFVTCSIALSTHPTPHQAGESPCEIPGGSLCCPYPAAHSHQQHPQYRFHPRPSEYCPAPHCCCCCWLRGCTPKTQARAVSAGWHLLCPWLQDEERRLLLLLFECWADVRALQSSKAHTHIHTHLVCTKRGRTAVRDNKQKQKNYAGSENHSPHQ